MGGSEGAETTRVADRPVSAQTRVNIPDSIAEIAKRTLAKVPEAHAIVLFGSRARGDADGTSDWDLMVRSHAMLPHNLMVLEGIVPKDGWVGRGERVQSVSLSDYEEALEDADAIESMNGNAATTRQGVYAISTMDPEIRERAIRDMRWERTGGRWETLLALHARTLRRLQRVEGPAGNAASEAVGLNLAAGKRMMREIADPEIEEIIPPEARQATLDWMREIEALEKTEPAPTLAVLHITESAWATATQRKTGTALRRGDLKRALALNEHWTPDNLPETPRQKQILAACEQWKKNRNVDLDEIESLMRSERRKAIMEVGDATMRLCKTLRAAAEDTMNTQGEEGLETALRRHTQANPEIGVLDAQDMGIIAENVAEAARGGWLNRLDGERIAHTVSVDRTRRERENALRKSRDDGGKRNEPPHTL